MRLDEIYVMGADSFSYVECGCYVYRVGEAFFHAKSNIKTKSREVYSLL